MEIDAIFFLQNELGRRLAIHLEMKRDREALSHGQDAAYKPRAECYRDQRRRRPAILPHDDYLTVLICGYGTNIEVAHEHFDRVILHEDARKVFLGYP